MTSNSSYFYTSGYRPTSSYVRWAIETQPNGSYLVVGTHSSGISGDEPKREVYQFQTREWAGICKRCMERLSGSTTLLNLSDNCAITSSTEYLTPAYISQLMETITIRRALAHSLKPVVTNFKTFWEALLWGETGKAKK